MPNYGTLENVEPEAQLSFKSFQLQYRLAVATSLICIGASFWLPHFWTASRHLDQYSTYLAGILAFTFSDSWSKRCRFSPTSQALAEEATRLLALVVVLGSITWWTSCNSNDGYIDGRRFLAFYLGSGFAVASCAVRGFDLLQHVTLYKDILNSTGSPITLALAEEDDIGDFIRPDSSQISQIVNTDVLDVWNAIRKREALEEVLGQPLYEIPAFVLLLWTLDTTLFSNALTFLLLAPIGVHTLILFLLVSALHALQSSMWSHLVPRHSLVVATYIGLLVNSGLLVMALALHRIIR